MCEEGLHDPFQNQVDCARFRAERDMLAQAMERVADDIERTFLGFEGAEDAPAMRWARQFRAALGSLHAPVRDATTSACDLTPDEDREAIAWVREHGGINDVESLWNDYCTITGIVGRALWGASDMVPSPLSAEQLRDILDRRLMPEGYEWPRYEDGEPVLTGNVLLDANGEAFRATSFLFTCDWWSVKGYQGTDFCTISKDTRRELSGMPYSRRVKRPAPKVYDADGAEIREGDRVWSTNLDEPHEWIVIDPHEDRDDSQTVLVSIGDRTGHARPEDLTHRAPVLAADGEPLEVGQTVWGEVGTEFAVKSINHKLKRFTAIRKYDGWECSGLNPMAFTHQRPVLDADGVPIKEGDTVWCVATDDELTDMSIIWTNWSKMREKLTVKSFTTDVHGDKWADFEETFFCVKTRYLTHAKPEPPDTWERIEDDAAKQPYSYCVERGLDDDAFPTNEKFARDLVRRCKALAERGE